MVSGQDFPWPRIDPLLLIAQRFAAPRARGDIFVGLQGGVVTVTWQLGNGVGYRSKPTLVFSCIFTFL